MARPTKSGLEYFSLDVDLDDKMELVEAKYGLEGFGIVIKLLQLIYKNGYYYELSDERLLLFKKRINADINLINDVINDGLRWTLFSNEMYQKHKILTSRGIQKRYIEGTKRRASVEFIKDYLLVDIGPETYSKKVTVTFIKVSACNMSAKTPVTSYIGTQSKVKESKVKETDTTVSVSVGSEPAGPAPDGPPLPPDDDLPIPDPEIMSIPMIPSHGDYPIYQSQIDEWGKDYPGIDVIQELIKCKNWNKGNPSKRKTKTGILKHIFWWLGKAQDECTKVRHMGKTKTANPMTAYEVFVNNG